MNSQFSEAISKNRERAADEVGSVTVLRQPPSKAADKSPDIARTADLRRRYGRLTIELGLRLVDLCMLALAAEAAGLSTDGGTAKLIPLGVALLVTNIVFSARGLYRDALSVPGVAQIARCMTAWLHAFGCWLISIVLIDFAMDFTRISATGLTLAVSYHERFVAVFFLCGIVFIAAGRFAFVRILALTPLPARARQRTYILGGASGGQSVSRNFAGEYDTNLQVLGFFDDGETGIPPSCLCGLPWLGGIASLIRLIHQGQVDVVLITTRWSKSEMIDDLMRRLAGLPVSVRLVPDPIPFQFPYRMVWSAAGLPLLQACEPRLSDYARVLKRLEDLILTPLLLLLVAPVMAVIAIAIKLDSTGPLLFSQRRYGIDNKVIKVHKFRSMHQHQSDKDCERQTVRGDHRLTRTGKILRSLSLDELPQLFNVLAGEMSLVGPRPHALCTKAEGLLYQDAVATYMARHRVMPGITGWAQVNGWRGETDSLEKITRRVEHDLYYIGNWSVGFDLWILCRTMFVILNRKNAY